MRRRPRLRWILGSLLFVGVCGLVGYRSMRPVPVTATPVVRGRAVEAIYATGTVEAGRRVTVKAKIGGPVAALQAHEGDTIHAGDLLASVDNPAATFDLKRGELDASAASAQIGPQLAATRARISALEAQLGAAQREATRIHALVSDGALATAEDDRARDRVTDLEAQLAGARADLSARQIDLDTSASRAKALVGSLSTRVSDAEIRSPQDGVVLARFVEPGEVVAQNQALFKVGDTRTLLLEVSIDETDVARVHDGSHGTVVSRVAASLHAFPGKSFAGHVTTVLPDANRETKSYLAKIALEDPPEGMRSGMTVEVNIIVSEHEDALLAPADAVKDGRVWRVTNGRASRVPVTLGIHDLVRSEILSGVDEGDSIVIGGVELLEKDGARVTATTQKPDVPAGAR